MEMTMTHASHPAAQPLSDVLLGFVANGAAGLLETIRSRRQQAYARELFDGLSDAALKDVGIDRSTVSPARPVIEVKAGVIGRLMSMT
jgi:uncharacterized protein YjiS (DUF1127 family)